MMRKLKLNDGIVLISLELKIFLWEKIKIKIDEKSLRLVFLFFEKIH